jgi:hypothetical protein
MALSIRQRSGPAPLTVQVTQAERRLLYHRQMVGFRASRLSQNLRRQLTSPTVLLLAGGLGFVAGQLKKRDADDTERPARNEFVGTALKLVSLFAALLRRHPAAAIDPLGSGLPSEAGSVNPVAASPGQATS